MSIWIKDPKTGHKSATLTLMVVGYFVCMAKLVVAGMTVNSVTFGDFSGFDFAAAVGALGALYGVRKYTDTSAGANRASRISSDGTKPPVEGEGR